MTELCDVNQSLLSGMAESDTKEFIECFAKATKIGLRIGLTVGVFQMKK